MSGFSTYPKYEGFISKLPRVSGMPSGHVFPSILPGFTLYRANTTTSLDKVLDVNETELYQFCGGIAPAEWEVLQRRPSEQERDNAIVTLAHVDGDDMTVQVTGAEHGIQRMIFRTQNNYRRELTVRSVPYIHTGSYGRITQRIRMGLGEQRVFRFMMNLDDSKLSWSASPPIVQFTPGSYTPADEVCFDFGPPFGVICFPIAASSTGSGAVVTITALEKGKTTITATDATSGAMDSIDIEVR